MKLAYDMDQNTKVYNHRVLPVKIYGTETCYGIRNEEISTENLLMFPTGKQDEVTMGRVWALPIVAPSVVISTCYIARTDCRWGRKILECSPYFLQFYVYCSSRYLPSCPSVCHFNDQPEGVRTSLRFTTGEKYLRSIDTVSDYHFISSQFAGAV